jgi:capsular exopolysaccharide synthesis family protein
MPVIGLIPQWFTKKSEGGKRFSRERFDSVRDPNQIQRNYEGRLLSAETPFAVSESFKTLRTNLTYVAHKDHTSPVFGVTSGFAGAGKSVVIANVAISFAQLGKKVLLIDGDMRCPVQHKIFSLEGERHGLSEVLAGIESKPFENAVVKNACEGLDVLACGHIPPNPSELLASERMQQLLAEAKAQYDYIFIDLPPILETADAGVMTSIVSSYILVVRAGYSKLPAVKGMVETMQTMRASVAGFVLNDISAKGALGYYHYGSRYSY